MSALGGHPKTDRDEVWLLNICSRLDIKGGLATFTQLVKAGKLFSKKEYDNQREKIRGKMICCRGVYTYWKEDESCLIIAAVQL